MSRDVSRQVARKRLNDLLALLQTSSASNVEALRVEAESLGRAIDAFHLEAIRLRMFRMDRMLQNLPGLPPEAFTILADIRTALEAAGVHTRSH